MFGNEITVIRKKNRTFFSRTNILINTFKIFATFVKKMELNRQYQDYNQMNPSSMNIDISALFASSLRSVRRAPLKIQSVM